MDPEKKIFRHWAAQGPADSQIPDPLLIQDSGATLQGNIDD